MFLLVNDVSKSIRHWTYSWAVDFPRLSLPLLRADTVIVYQIPATTVRLYDVVSAGSVSLQLFPSPEAEDVVGHWEPWWHYKNILKQLCMFATSGSKRNVPQKVQPIK